MMSLGMFGFSLPTAAYQELQRQTSWSHADTKRLGARAASQFLGPDTDKITLSGVLLPEVAGDPAALDELRGMGDDGEAWPLVDGTGKVYGAFRIDSLSETQSVFFDDGVARKYDFSLQLTKVDDAQGRAAGSTQAAPPPSASGEGGLLGGLIGLF